MGRYLLLLALKMWFDLPARRTTTVIISKTRLEYNEEDPYILDRIMWMNESKFTNNFTPPIFSTDIINTFLVIGKSTLDLRTELPS